MKKIARLFVPLLLVIGLAGCNKESGEKIVVEKDENATTTVEIQSSDLQAKQENKDNFILFIYQDGCTACEAFKPYLEDVIYIFQIVVYSIEARSNLSYLKDNVKDLKYTPTIVIYKNGKQYKKADPASKKNAFNSSDGFASYLFNYVTVEE